MKINLSWFPIPEQELEKESAFKDQEKNLFLKPGNVTHRRKIIMARHTKRTKG